MTTTSHATPSATESFGPAAIFLDGRFVATDGDPLPVTDKATGDLIGTTASATPADVDRAVAGAVAAQPDWYAMPVTERAAILRRAGAGLEAAVQTLSRRADPGGRCHRAQGRWRNPGQCARVLPIRRTRDGADGRSDPVRATRAGQPGRAQARRRHRSHHGVECPAAHCPSRASPAIALGNAVVLKTRPETPFAGGLMIAEILTEAGLPAGVCRHCLGRRRTRTGNQPEVAMIHFTESEQRPVDGSTPTLLPCSNGSRWNWSGNNASIVLSDADVDLAARCGATPRSGIRVRSA